MLIFPATAVLWQPRSASAGLGFAPPCRLRAIRTAESRLTGYERNGYAAGSRPVVNHLGIVQSLLLTCRLHDIDPHEYLIDTMEQVKDHRPLQMDELTLRRWKQLFASNPLRLPLYPIDRMRIWSPSKVDGAYLPVTLPVQSRNEEICFAIVKLYPIAGSRIQMRCHQRFKPS